MCVCVCVCVVCVCVCVCVCVNGMLIWMGGAPLCRKTLVGNIDIVQLRPTMCML